VYVYKNIFVICLLIDAPHNHHPTPPHGLVLQSASQPPKTKGMQVVLVVPHGILRLLDGLELEGR
jgi:hypothetical protein